MTEHLDRRVIEAVEAEAEEGRIPCARALALARRLGVDPKKIGEACNRARVKIVHCQLGCFG
ncbi:MAG: hypothetical protein ACYTFZ_06750 [Planctomycetota bacterium]|jgi:hypothetical protein